MLRPRMGSAQDCREQRRWLAVVMLLICLGCLSGRAAENAVIQQQGYLARTLGPAHGTFDMRFSVHSGGGVPIRDVPAPFQTNLSVPVNQGLFSVQLHLGQQVDLAEDLYLEISIRENGTSNSFEVLEPRQRIRPTPVSLWAATAEGARFASNAVTAASVPTLFWRGTVVTNASFLLSLRDAIQAPDAWSGMATNEAAVRAFSEGLTGNRVFYVDPTMPLSAISNVFLRLPSHGTIFFLPGTYFVAAGLKTAGFEEKDFTASFKLLDKAGVRIAGLGRVILVPTNGPGDVIAVQGCSNLLIENLEIRWPTRPDVHEFTAAIALAGVNHRGTVRNVRIFNYPNHGINQIHGLLRTSTNWLVERCYFENGGQMNWKGVPGVVDGAAVQADNSWTVRDCHFRNLWRGIEVQSNPGDTPIDDVLIKNNLFEDIREWGVGSFTAASGNRLTIENNRFVQNIDRFATENLASHGVLVRSGRQVSIVGNQFAGPLIAGVLAEGARLGGLLISDNQFSRNYSGVFLDSISLVEPLVQCIVRNNTFDSCRNWGFAGDPTSLLLLGNTFENCGSQYPVALVRNGFLPPVSRVLIEGNTFLDNRRPPATDSAVGIGSGLTNVVIRANHRLGNFRLADDPSGRNVVVSAEDRDRGGTVPAPGLGRICTNGPARALMTASFSLTAAGANPAGIDVIAWRSNRWQTVARVDNPVGDSTVIRSVSVFLNPGEKFSLNSASVPPASASLLTNTWQLSEP